MSTADLRSVDTLGLPPVGTSRTPLGRRRPATGSTRPGPDHPCGAAPVPSWWLSPRLSSRSPTPAGALVRIAVTGSIATDHLMTFPGRFSDSLVADQLDKVSLSFLVEDLDIRRGGVAANIAFGMGCLGPPTRSSSAPSAPTSRTTAPGWSGTASTPRRCTCRDVRHTARFVCTTDTDAQPDRVVLPRRDERGPRHRARPGRRPGRRPRPRRRSAPTTRRR